MIPDPGTTRLIHDHMVEEELQRQRPADERRQTEPWPIQSPRHVLREAIAGSVYRLATVIDPRPRVQPPSVAPAEPSI